MTLSDLLITLALLTFAIGLPLALADLHRHGDVERRLMETHATVYARIARSALALAHHVRCAVTDADAQGGHGEKAFFEFALLGALVVAPLLAAVETAAPQLAQHSVAVALGFAAWSVVIEVPGQVHRHPHLSPTPTPLPPLALVLIVLALDASVSLVALSGIVDGGAMSGGFHGAALVALPDALSGLLGVVAAASAP